MGKTFLQRFPFPSSSFPTYSFSFPFLPHGKTFSLLFPSCSTRRCNWSGRWIFSSFSLLFSLTCQTDHMPGYLFDEGVPPTMLVAWFPWGLNMFLSRVIISALLGFHLRVFILPVKIPVSSDLGGLVNAAPPLFHTALLLNSVLIILVSWFPSFLEHFQPS
jgi:hypothetical protein